MTTDRPTVKVNYIKDVQNNGKKLIGPKTPKIQGKIAQNLIKFLSLNEI